MLQGNYIGTAADGVSPLGNGGNGLVVACCATVGGTTAGAGNVIAFNAGAGVLTDLNRDAIRRNSIFSNGTLGIDNGNYQNRGDGVTKANRNCAGANFPVLTSAVLGSTTAISGTVNNDINASVDIDLFGNASCDISGYGQGHTYLGSVTVTTDSSCNASFNLTLPLVNWAEPFVTATATNINGPNLSSSSTSEFSQCLLAKVPSATSNVGGTQSGNPGDSLPASVRVLDSAGNPIAGITVTFSVTQGSATLSAAIAITDLNGIASVQVRLGPNPGTVVVTATSNGLPVVKLAYSAVSGSVPQINAGGVVGAGLSIPPKTTVTTNGIASVFGLNFAPAGTAKLVGTGDLVNGNVPTNFSGVCVEVGAVRAPVFAVYTAQVNFQLPTASGINLPVQVITGCGTPSELRSNAGTVTVQAAAPEFFFFVTNSDGHNPIAAVDAITGAYIGGSGLLTGVTTTPATVNEAVSLFGTSFGGTNPPIQPGTFPTGIASVTASVVVTMGGVTVPQADILYAGAAPNSPGLFQLNMIVPPGTPDGDLPLVLTIGGVSSPPGAYLTVKSAQ